jgi:hypothetical protein
MALNNPSPLAVAIGPKNAPASAVLTKPAGAGAPATITPIPKAPPVPATPTSAVPPTSAATDDFTDMHQYLRFLQDQIRTKLSPENTPQPPVPYVPPPAPQTKQYNPVEAWGSSAMIIATLGSLLTRGSMTNALNAAAGVMNAHKQGDTDAANAAMATWKAETTNAINLQKYETEAYKEAITAHKDDIQELTTAMTTTATALKDDVMLGVIKSQGVLFAAELAAKRAGAGANAAQQAAAGVQYQDSENKAQAWMKAHPEPADPSKKSQWQDDKNHAMAGIFSQQISNSGSTQDPGDIPNPVTGVSNNFMRNLVLGDMSGINKEVTRFTGPLAPAKQDQYNAVKASIDAGLMGPTPGKGLGANPAPDSPLGELRNVDPPAYDKGQLIATYRLPAATAGAMGSSGNTAVMQMVMKINPDYDVTNYLGKAATVLAYDKGSQSKSVISYNVLMQHLDVLKKLGMALQNNDVQAVNSLSNQLSAQFGDPQMTNFNAAKGFVADELVKAITGGPGALADRTSADDLINKAMSPAQFTQAIQTWEGLAAGQLAGLQKQYEAGTGLDDFSSRYLDAPTQALLQTIQPIAPPAALNAAVPIATPSVTSAAADAAASTPPAVADPSAAPADDSGGDSTAGSNAGNTTINYDANGNPIQ